MRLIIPLALALTLGGCAFFDNATERDPVKEVIAGCNAISGSLAVLTPNKDKLSAKHIAAVDNAIDVSEPICTADDPPATAADLIMDLAQQLAALETDLVGDF